MKKLLFLLFAILILRSPLYASPPVSPETQGCLECHQHVSQGLVDSWKKSLHASTTIEKSLKSGRLTKTAVPESKHAFVVGCAECHTINTENRDDVFDHGEYKVHMLVTPKDCAVCHMEEARQYSESKKAWAEKNLTGNPLYMELANQTNSVQSYKNGEIVLSPSDYLAEMDSCLSCHGSRVKVSGVTKHETELLDFESPKLVGWPNQGVGRLNPDNSRGSCTVCHTGHMISIVTARAPETCAQCHKGPDVPAYPVYSVSKHGKIYSSSDKKNWNMENSKWKPGEDFLAPTCAACHMSELTDNNGNAIVKRTHKLTDRLSERIFGLIYSHPHPESPDTTVLVNKSGLPLPTELDGTPVEKGLISKSMALERRQTMKNVCMSCHSSSWTDSHFEKLSAVVKYADSQVGTATGIVASAWDAGLIKGPGQGGSPFDDYLERLWVEQWLFHANSLRLSAAMGGADYGVFAGGRWYMAKNIRHMFEWLKNARESSQKTAP